jgi:membrane dipeptidase|tara:strand:+ start:348 stop:551 length:204 start_codon:yes stop_codon:yes gene_type:complete
MTNMLKNNLVWDAHAGLFPSPEMDLNILEDWRNNNVNYLSINVGFNEMVPDETLATLAPIKVSITRV